MFWMDFDTNPFLVAIELPMQRKLLMRLVILSLFAAISAIITGSE